MLYDRRLGAICSLQLRPSRCKSLPSCYRLRVVDSVYGTWKYVNRGDVTIFACKPHVHARRSIRWTVGANPLRHWAFGFELVHDLRLCFISPVLAHSRHTYLHFNVPFEFQFPIRDEERIATSCSSKRILINNTLFRLIFYVYFV